MTLAHDQWNVVKDCNDNTTNGFNDQCQGRAHLVITDNIYQQSQWYLIIFCWAVSHQARVMIWSWVVLVCSNKYWFIQFNKEVTNSKVKEGKWNNIKIHILSGIFPNQGWHDVYYADQTQHFIRIIFLNQVEMSSINQSRLQISITITASKWSIQF